MVPNPPPLSLMRLRWSAPGLRSARKQEAATREASRPQPRTGKQAYLGAAAEVSEAIRVEGGQPTRLSVCHALARTDNRDLANRQFLRRCIGADASGGRSEKRAGIERPAPLLDSTDQRFMQVTCSSCSRRRIGSKERRLLRRIRSTYGPQATDISGHRGIDLGISWI